MKINLKEKLENARRILSITKKPSLEDLKYSARICALGIALVGLIGFIVYMLSILFIG
jgi:protein translocase SEC61 complex gamma subunit